MKGKPSAGFVPGYQLEEAFVETGYLSTGTISVLGGAAKKKGGRQPIGYASKPRRRKRKKR